jgi:leucyl/phenylalanyl-tRNA---protein transferase
MSRRIVEITPELMLRAYRHGLFPMAETRRGDRLYWLDPERRGIILLDRFHLPKRLLRTVLSGAFEVTADHDFPATILGCAASAPGREDTWINPQIEHLFGELFRLGFAHSVECRHGGALVGGLYGVAMGGVFFGESMFSSARDASKVALVHLAARLRMGGFQLIDTQFMTSHLAQFGTEELSRERYKTLLSQAVESPATWIASPDPAAIEAQIRTMGSRSRQQRIAPRRGARSSETEIA